VSAVRAKEDLPAQHVKEMERKLANAKPAQGLANWLQINSVTTVLTSTRHQQRNKKIYALISVGLEPYLQIADRR
jgi:hypothetical protein